MTLTFPLRYQPLRRLGQGGGGEVWAVRDRYQASNYALKVLGEDATEAEMAALVREAVALSGLEGLGVPRVQRFGRLPGSGRPFMVRELVEGRSLLDLIDSGHDLRCALDAVARAADQLTEVHRAGLFHGDVKPANVIVAVDGAATLVDLGLSAPWREGGTKPEGLTPKYAAPELFEGLPLTVRAEVYALGATLAEALEKAPSGAVSPTGRQAVEEVSSRATAARPDQRFPSADEFAVALRRAAGLRQPTLELEPALGWPVVGIDATAGRLLDASCALPPGAILRVEGPVDSGRTVLVRRLAWSLGIEGRPLVWLDGALASSAEAIRVELGAYETRRGLLLLIDDANDLAGDAEAEVSRALAEGARAVVVGSLPPGDGIPFGVPPLEPRAAADLIRRAVPSLTENLIDRAYELAGGRPGILRRLVRRIARSPVASEADIVRALAGSAHDMTSVTDALSPLGRARALIDRGRYSDARPLMDAVADHGLAAEIERARLDLGLGNAAQACARLRAAEPLADAALRDQAVEARDEAVRWRVFLARALIGVAEYRAAIDLVRDLVDDPTPLGVEALSYAGLAESYLGNHDAARRSLEGAVERAVELGFARTEAVALSSLGVALQRGDHVDEARQVYERAIDAAERAGEAGLLGSTQLNLAGVLKVGGDLARAIELFEAAVDMGRRSGRLSTVRNALLNLANTDLYLGRLGRARASIEALDEQRAELAPFVQAQIIGQKAELAARNGEVERALLLYEQCADAYAALGRGIDAAEASLEGVLVGSRAGCPDVTDLRQKLEQAQIVLGDRPVHRPLALLAAARVAWLGRDVGGARRSIDAALQAAQAAAQREWIWRALEIRAELAELAGQSVAARRDREEALAVLEEIGARLPRDLREVYWNDARRRALRDSVKAHVGHAVTERFSAAAYSASSPPPPEVAASDRQRATARAQTSQETRLARILEINGELAGEIDLDRLTARITDHAVDLLRAERGFVVLLGADGSLTVHTSRTRLGDEPHAEFSRSIARSVLAKGEPLVSLSARDDQRMAAYASVHQLALHSVACAPIHAPSGPAIGALYVETRHRPGLDFERELPTLVALANQVAIAIENARLVLENRRRAEDLARANERLEEAHARLRELLGDRTEQLKRARQKLRETRDTLYGHFGYQGLVGTSAAMRRVYALIDRVKDTDIPVLITGESGTGKEMVARAIHDASLRAKGKFLGVNCGAIPDNLLESELFGHVRGAFTGADRERKGLFRECQGGTVLLDEIGEMATKMQAGMLRVLQERKVRPVGGTQEEDVDVRTIFATHRDLEAMVSAGQFREDLYYRIHVVVVPLPPLRQRPEDVPQLVDHFLGRFAARYKRERGTVSREALRVLTGCEWPGNVRQLEHVLLNAWILADGPEVDVGDLALPGGPSAVDSIAPLPLPDAVAAERRADAAPSAARSPRATQGTLAAAGSACAPATSAEPEGGRVGRGTGRSISQHHSAERERIVQALEACNWNRVKAAELSGIPRRTFYRRLREYGIQ
ncbi:MAG: sigma 54-interacting transcriptional regulator [Polyangiaceae bacterium]|nr:sigma 54-interacting transcriptional regulator [Polyangiaceae bacterium]